MRRVVFLLEERSMKEFLIAFLPRFVPAVDFLCVTHEGKQDLEKSIPRKIKAFRGALFVVIRDNDGADCRAVKESLRRLCDDAGGSDAVIRIACQELEAWYLGVPGTLAEVYGTPGLATLGRKARYRNPDHIGSPSAELGKLVPQFRKLDGARRMGSSMPLRETGNASGSFRVFVEGIRKVAHIATR